jgi:hypothetical protein
MDQTPTSFETVVVIDKEWTEVSKFWVLLHPDSGMKSHDTKGVAFLETIDDFNCWRNFESMK